MSLEERDNAEMGLGTPCASAGGNGLTVTLYDELRRLAGVFLDQERCDHTLQPTALIHEAYLRLVRQEGLDWTNRMAFCAAAANTMRRVLVDHARARGCRKRGGPETHRVALDTSPLMVRDRVLDILDLEDALQALGEIEPRLARLVELRFFGGLSENEAAEVLSVSRRTVQLDWRAAKAWLARELAA